MASNQPLPVSEMVVSHIDHETIMQEIMATHNPDSKDFQVNFIFNTVKNILCPITTIGKSIPEDEESNEESDEELFDYKDFGEGEPNNEEFKDVEFLCQIKRLSFETTLKCWDNADQHTTVIYFMKMLSIFSWDVKILMMLAAFSIMYGEFSFVNGHKGLSTKLATVKGIPAPMVPSHVQFIKLLLQLTKYIVELAKSSSHSSASIIPVSCYWIFTSILACTSNFARFPRANSKWPERTQLSSLAAKVKDLILECRPIIEKKREEESYQALCCAFSEESPVPSSNLDVLKLLFNVKRHDKKKLIYDGLTEKMVGLHSLNNKGLLLLISPSLDIDIHLRDLLHDVEWKIKLRTLWIPILDCPTLWTTNKNVKEQFRGLVNVHHLLSMRNPEKSVSLGLVRFVKEKVLHIGGEPIIISLDHHGRITHRNAMHLIWIRLGVIFTEYTTESSEDSIVPFLQTVLKKRTLDVREFVPHIDREISDFTGEMNSKVNDWLHGIIRRVNDPIYSNIYTCERENNLWKEVTWCTKLLSSDKRGQLSVLVDANEYIFLMGGNDINWVKKFKSKVLCVNPQLAFVMSYIGTNIKVALTIAREKICEYSEPCVAKDFWTRQQSMFLSRIQFLNEIHRDEKSDEIVEGLKRLLAYEAKGSTIEGCVLLAKRNKIILCDLGDKMLTVMNEYEKWKDNAIAKGFDQAFKDHHEMLASTSTSHHHPYCALEYPSNFNQIPENEKCPQCCYNMNKFVTFTCCHGHSFILDDDDDGNGDGDGGGGGDGDGDDDTN
ncbi:protein SIEVE ELEMENT OCCLUSION B-like [Ipomoea triloba]|uniref:protein SIEVE ELEMENT OCCLUSION B-like n=1 Tax=Ipomoea triloba TaxID=35885 RepID=UPI00125E172D|nr:protein SIEVE ELEMENT OCCLUSION B-like [Ipomoea triloba]